MGIVIAKDDLIEKAYARKQAGERVVITRGAFDLLHPGHISFLEDARSSGDILIVALEDDASVRKNKGNDRPVLPEQERAELLAALACVDYVVIGNEISWQAMIERIGPDVVAGNAARHSAEGRKRGAVSAPETPRYSTSALIERARNLKRAVRMPAGESSQQHRKE